MVGGRTELCKFIEENVTDKPLEEGELAIMDWLQTKKGEDITNDRLKKK